MRWRQLFLFFSASVVCLSLFTQTVNAASVWDYVIQTTNDLIITSGNGEHTENIVTDYSAIMSDKCPSMYSAFSAAVADPNGKWAIVKQDWPSPTRDSVRIQWTTNVSATTQFTDSGGQQRVRVNLGSGQVDIYLNNDGTFGCSDITGITDGFLTLGSGYGTPSTEPAQYVLLSTYPVTYPVGYDGALIPESWTPPPEKTNLNPDYSWSVGPDGKIEIKYLGNLDHFLTGIGYVVIDKMTDNWESLDEEIDSQSTTPAGWMDIISTLPEAGYYMINISHNQQLDSPPWPPDAEDLYHINQRWIQIYWDGTKAINGTTVGCTDSICNDFRAENNNEWSFFDALNNINTFGLQSFLTAPITFFQSLPDMADSCSAISFVFLGSTINIPCLKSYYWSFNSTVMDMYTILINAGASYLVALNIFRNVKNLNSPHKDQIEVAKL